MFYLPPLSIQGRRYQLLSIENKFDVIEKRAPAAAAMVFETIYTHGWFLNGWQLQQAAASNKRISPPLSPYVQRDTDVHTLVS